MHSVLQQLAVSNVMQFYLQLQLCKTTTTTTAAPFNKTRNVDIIAPIKIAGNYKSNVQVL